MDSPGADPDELCDICDDAPATHVCELCESLQCETCKTTPLQLYDWTPTYPKTCTQCHRTGCDWCMKACTFCLADAIEDNEPPEILCQDCCLAPSCQECRTVPKCSRHGWTKQPTLSTLCAPHNTVKCAAHTPASCDECYQLYHA